MNLEISFMEVNEWFEWSDILKECFSRYNLKITKISLMIKKIK